MYWSLENVPWTNLHDLNLDWIVNTMKETVEQWIAYRLEMNQRYTEFTDQIENWQAEVENSFEELQQYVQDYFDNLDLNESTRYVINQMIASGEFIQVLNPSIVTAVNAWLANHITPTTPAVDDTLSISGAAADAAVTGSRITDADNRINIINPQINYVWTLYRSVNADGTFANTNYRAITNEIPCEYGDFIVSNTPKKDSNNIDLLLYIAEYNGDTFIRRTRLFEPNESVILSPNCTKVIIDFGRAASSETVITQNDINTYFSIDFYRTSLNRQEYYDNAFIMRGRLSDLGYNTLGECVQSGAYVFTTGDSASISDLPAFWEPSGGILLTYKNGNRIWQNLKSPNSSFIRYGTTGSWIPENKGIFLRNSEEASVDNSIEQIDVFIPRDTTGASTRYQMGKCVNADVNANVWRLMYVYTVNAAGEETVMTRKGEFECAVHLAGQRDDFSGGIVHGDELDEHLVFKKDGRSISRSEATGFCNEFMIVRNSKLYDPLNHSRAIAVHGVEYKFTVDGLTITQAIRWLVEEDLTDCYLAMFPILKTFSTYRYSDRDLDVVANPTSNYNVNIPLAKMVTEYVANNTSTMSIDDYPTGLPGGDKASITDNGGLPYNKIYFVVCSSGRSSIGEIWTAKTKYQIR